MVDRKRIIDVVLLLAILGLALFLRVRHLSTTKIWADQALTLTTAMQWVNGGKMPLAANKSSAGFMNPPMIEYLFAAALCVWPDILSVAIMTLLSGMAAVALTGWATYRVFGKRAALWAMLVFAVNPLGVLYSQQIWNQTMVPLFAALTFAGLLLYFAYQQRPWYLILSFIGAACMTQVHPGTLIQVITMGLVCVLFWRKLKVWPLLIGSAIFLLSYVPFLLYESSVGWIDVHAALGVAQQPTAWSPAAILLSLDLMHAQGLSRGAPYVRLFDGLATLLLVLSFAYTVWAAVRACARRREQSPPHNMPAYLILLLWFVLPVLFYLRSAHYLQVYYLIGQWPVHFIMIGICIAGLQARIAQAAQKARQKRIRRALKAIAWIVLPLPVLVWVVWQAWFTMRDQEHRLQVQKGSPQIRHVRAAIETSRRLLADYPSCDLVVVSRGHHLEASELSLMREFLSRDRVLLTDGDMAVPLPDPCAIYLDAQAGSRVSTWLADALPAPPQTTIDVLGERWGFYHLSTQARAELLTNLTARSPLARWQNGVALAQYERGALRPGEPLPVTLVWSVETQSPEEVYHFGSYLLTLQDQVVAQSDGPGFDSIQWRAGDAFITWFEIPVPTDLSAGDYRVAVALYTWPDLERITMTSGANTAYLEQLIVAE